MRRDAFYYDLPEHLIAQHPVTPRHSARLLSYVRNTNQLTHHASILELVEHLTADDLLICNNTKVLPARLFGQKRTGGQVEVLMERLLADDKMLCHMRASKAPKPNTEVVINAKWVLKILGRHDDLFEVQANGNIVDLLHEVGHMPLPPYIDREDEESDKKNYQTVFAKHLGSVAAPTAGLHFDEVLLAKLQEKQIAMEAITLHVGSGTFRPVRADLIKDHVMHYEWYEVTESLVEKIKNTKAKGGRVIAIGTTALRALESAAQHGFKASSGLTNLFITPGYAFQVIDGLMTNFHLPESTLLMLVSALVGYEQAMAIYHQAVANEYRFFSYGDACLFL